MEIFSLDIPGVPKLLSGKVREVFEISDEVLLIVASDRLSAFDCVFAEPIPQKGAVLNQLSAFWFNFFNAKKNGTKSTTQSTTTSPTKPTLGNHYITANFAEFPQILHPFADKLEGRSMLVKRSRPFPIEFIVRGYIAGNGWKEYQSSGQLCGQKLPSGLRLGDRIPDDLFPLFTPSSKAAEGHDEFITWDQYVQALNGNTELAVRLRDAAKYLYQTGLAHAESKGIIIADTKFEFGIDQFNHNEIVLIDECLTPDSSRFWPISTETQTTSGWKSGSTPPSLDKQFVRDYLETLSWNKQPPAPHLPPEVIQQTSDKYLSIFRLLTGKELELGVG